MHKPIFEDRFAIDKKGQIVLITNARGRGFDVGHNLKLFCEFDCAKTYETGEQWTRNLYINTLYGGYYVEYPQEYYKNRTGEVQRRGYSRYAKCDKLCNLQSMGFTQKDAEIILSKYPDFKYVLQKWTRFKTKFDVLKVLRIWKEHKEIELPLSLGYERVIYTKSFFKSKKEDLKKMYKYMANHPNKDLPLLSLRYIVKNGEEKYEVVKKASLIMARKVKYDFAKWVLNTVDGGYNPYRLSMDYPQYLRWCKTLEKDIKADYWTMPSNFSERYKEIETEIDNIRRMEEKKSAEKKMSDYLERIQKYTSLHSFLNGYEIYVPTTIEEWSTQAEVLHQCIIRMNYIDKCNENYLLVFIAKDGNPCATVELTDVLQKKVGQFYADEEDRLNCNPDEETQEVFYSWLDNLQVA